jgi:hypothetical protein
MVYTIGMKIRDAYFAGIMDGEASFRLEKRRDGYLKPTIEVKMSCETTVRALSDYFGGSVVPRRPERAGYKQQWRWRAQDRAARVVLARVLPYLITKRADAMRLREYDEMRGLK